MCAHARDSQHSVCVCVHATALSVFFFYHISTSSSAISAALKKNKKKTRSSRRPSLLLAITKRFTEHKIQPELSLAVTAPLYT